MKKILLFLPLVLFATLATAQCDDLFFSEYVEGYSNNKSLEIYNPTDQAVNMSDYSIARFSNGSFDVDATTIIKLPNYMLAAKGTYIVTVDLTDTDLFDSQFDKPVWNGYNVVDTIFDSVTGDPVLDDDGNVLIGPQYNDNGAALFQDDYYNEEYDLQCKTSAFLCPDYDANNTMYFNGNDAMALLKGDQFVDGSNLLDVIGVIGEDPTDDGEDAWVDADGGWLTKDKTIVRMASVNTGRKDPSDVSAALGGSFMGEEWIVYPKNSFQYLGTHNSVCNNNAQPDEITCEAIALNTSQLNLIPFTMSPNPTYGLFNIEAPEAISTIVVYNFMGQLVHSQSVANASNLSIDLSGFSAGMYLVDITFESNQRSVEKLVIE
ncbi:MAG: T9SS type A sorting domain-containing protein [Saprospiraceae bacterium]